MLREKLENEVGTLTNSEFKIICEIATDDLKFNRVSFKKYSNLNYVIDIAIRSVNIFKKCA